MRIVPERKRKVHIGQQFGSLTIIGQPFYIRQIKADGFWASHVMVVCECDCGNIVADSVQAVLRRKQPRCQQLCKLGNQNPETRLRRIWSGMLSRCFSKSSNAFRFYGSRGITVCDEWLWFPAFLQWAIGSGYKCGLSIDRKDKLLGYHPGNCRFILRSDNSSRNRRGVIFAFGSDRHVDQWVMDDRCSVSKQTILHRMSRGMSAEQAIATPPRNQEELASLNQNSRLV